MKQGLSSILANKLRSSLSVLGIVIGISSVVIMLAIWEWAKASILQSFDSVDNLISVEKKYDYWPPEWQAWGWTTTTYNPSKEVVTMKIADEIPQKVRWVESSVYAANVNAWDIKYNSKPLYWQIQGISKEYLQKKAYHIQYGNAFSPENFINDEKVIILWYSLIHENFGKKNPLWQKIFLSGTPFIVVGILEKKNWNTDYAMYIPITTAVNRLWAKELEKIEVFADKSRDM